MREYFTSGASTPWWLLGTSMVATSFAADTPLTLAGWVVTNGLAQNWYWWCQVPVTLLGVFFIAALWRRANLVTDNEFVDLRYSGRSAAVLRGFKGLFFALVFNCIVMGWVNLAMTNIIRITLPDIPHVPVVDEAMLWTYLHTPMSNELPPETRAAMRSGKVDPLQLFYGDWSQLGRPQRPAVMREVELILKRFAVINERLANPAAFAKTLARSNQPGAAGANVTTELEKLREYAGSVQSAPYLAQLGLESREAELTARWNTLQSTSLKQEVAAPAALQYVNAVAVAVAGVNKLKIILLLFFIVTLYTVMSGLWGVLVTDFIQFWIAMTGCIVLAVMATQKLGGIDSVLHQMAEIYSLDRARGMVSMIPVSGAGDLDLMGWKAFLVFVLFSWYVLQYNRRRLVHGATHARRQERASCRTRLFVVRDRPLLHPHVALDYCRAGRGRDVPLHARPRDRPIPRRCGGRGRLHPRHARGSFRRGGSACCWLRSWPHTCPQLRVI